MSHDSADAARRAKQLAADLNLARAEFPEEAFDAFFRAGIEDAGLDPDTLLHDDVVRFGSGWYVFYDSGRCEWKAVYSPSGLLTINSRIVAADDGVVRASQSCTTAMHDDSNTTHFLDRPLDAPRPCDRCGKVRPVASYKLVGNDETNTVHVSAFCKPCVEERRSQ